MDCVVNSGYKFLLSVYFCAVAKITAPYDKFINIIICVLLLSHDVHDSMCYMHLLTRTKVMPYKFAARKNL